MALDKSKSERNHISVFKEIKPAILQGSVLKPISLFFIHELPIHIKEIKISLFAECTEILVATENGQILQQKISMVMNYLHSWVCANTKKK
jgi:hypothetical protein